MRYRHAATLASLMTAALTSLAAAQQAAPDSTHQARAMAHDQRAITADTIRLHRDIAVRDSARAALDREHQRTHAEGLQIDSLKARLAREEKATPRDSALVKRDLAMLTRDRRQLDQDLDRDRREAAHVDSIEQRVKKESDAAIDAHHELGRDRPAAPPAKTRDAARH
jgi:hypothetical protein